MFHLLMNQVVGFYIKGTLVENGLMTFVYLWELEFDWILIAAYLIISECEISLLIWTYIDHYPSSYQTETNPTLCLLALE